MRLHPIDGLVERVYAWSEMRLVAVDAAVAVFVIVAHGAALLVAQAQGHRDLVDIERTVIVSLPLAALVLTTAAWAAVRVTYRGTILRLHALAGAASGIWLLAWAMDLLIKGLPERSSFAWAPGMLSAWLLYTGVLFSRYSGLADARTRVRLPWLVAGTLALELGILLRLLM
jgi:hypothetical protein